MLIFICQIVYFTFNINVIKDANNSHYIKVISYNGIFTRSNQQFFIVRC